MIMYLMKVEWNLSLVEHLPISSAAAKSLQIVSNKISNIVPFLKYDGFTICSD